jgi:hypothetical protein
MSLLDVPSIETKELRARAWQQGDRLELKMAGTAEAAAVEPLAGLVRRLHGEALRIKPREVIVDLRELEFMNSGCFKSFVSWLAELQESDGSAQYAIRFLSDPNKHWQRRSLGALSCFAIDLVRIEA